MSDLMYGQFPAQFVLTLSLLWSFTFLLPVGFQRCPTVLN